MRNGEQALLNILLPLAALAASTQVDLTGEMRAALLSAFAISASSFAGVAIATAFDRRAGALRVFGISPLGRRGFVQARILCALVVSATQIAGLQVLAVVARIDFNITPGLILASCLLAIAWISLALLLASVLRAEAVLALANLLFVGALSATWLTRSGQNWFSLSNPTSAALHASFGDRNALIALGVWSIIALITAIRSFKWE